jgi:DNA polymerase III delta prime subunit
MPCSLEDYQKSWSELQRLCSFLVLPINISVQKNQEDEQLKCHIKVGRHKHASQWCATHREARHEACVFAHNALFDRHNPGQQYASSFRVHRPQRDPSMTQETTDHLIKIIRDTIADVQGNEPIFLTEVLEWFYEYDTRYLHWTDYTNLTLLDFVLHHPTHFRISIREGAYMINLVPKRRDPYLKTKTRKIRRTLGANDARTSGFRPLIERMDFENKLEQYFVPKEIDSLARTQGGPVLIDEVQKKLREYMLNRFGDAAYLQRVTTGSEYLLYFDTLLWLEEVQMKVDIRHYDLFGTTLTEKNGLCVIKVAGLAENRPSILRGDMVYVNPSINRQYVHRGYVHFVNLDEIHVSFFPDVINYNEPHDCQFTFTRTPLRRMHQALESLHIDRLLLDVHLRQEKWEEERNSVPEGQCNVPHMNELQRKAINLIACGKPKIPVVIIGPPGTGKTSTVVECIRQILIRDPHARILACTPSNESADLICSRLHAAYPPIRDNQYMIRLNSFQRNPNTISDKNVHEYCYQSVTNRSYFIPAKEVLNAARVIISTLASSGYIFAMGVQEHFTHVFIDECGQCIEPEGLIPLQAAKKDAIVAFAGDPKQLGPVIRSPVAIEYGLEISLLERFVKESNRSQQAYGYPCCHHIMLEDSYRAHPAITDLYSSLFYDTKLRAVGNESITYSMTNYPIFNSHGTEIIPVQFINANGVEERTADSPSWFNREEADTVLDLVQELVLHTDTNGVHITADDVGVITPYRKQVDHLKGKIRHYPHLRDVKIGTTEIFQGKEKKIIIITAVRSRSEYIQFDDKFKLGFLKNPKRMNVAISRARAALFIVGHANVLRLDEQWKKLINMIIEMGGYSGDLPDDYTDDYDEGFYEVEEHSDDDLNDDAPWPENY